MSSKLADVALMYQQDPKLKEQDVNIIFEWLQTQPHIPELTVLQVILFLHSCYYEVEATKVTIENYFMLRASSDLFLSGDEDLVKRTLAMSYTDVFPKKTPEGYCIWSIQILNPKPESFNFAEFTKVSIMSVSLHFHQEGPANGLVILVDLKNFSVGHLIKMSPNTVKIILQFLQEAVPTRIKGIHFVNVVSITKALITLARPFMKKEVYDVIQLHPHGFESLYEFIPKTCLPEKYGGDLGPVENLHEKSLENILGHFEFFKWHDAQQINEKKQVEKKNKGFFYNMFTSKSE